MTIRSRYALVGVLMLLSLPALAAAQTGTVTGTVTNAATAAPLARSVRFCTSTTSGTSCLAANTNASGAYSIALPAGTWVAFSEGFAAGVVDEVYDDVPCPTLCTFAYALATGANIVVTPGATLSGRNFALSPGRTVTGRVTDAATGAGVQNVVVQLRSMIAGTNAGVASTVSDATGAFSFQSIGAGTYYAFANGLSAGYTSEIHDDILCPGACNTATVVNSGTPIVVPPAGAPPVLAFALQAGATISGSVRDNSAAPLQNVNVFVYARVGQVNTQFGSATTNASGAYSVRGLPPGTYQVFTSNAPAINEIYNNLPCVGACTVADALNTGTPVTVAGGATAGGIDFALDPGGAISGTVLAAGSSAPVAAVQVQIYRQTGTASVAFVAFATTDATGAYTVRGVPTGTYFALAAPPGSYVSQVFGGQPCPVCSSDL
ncbi:MAG: carboxypeptidase regulatory-like domain-containing protein, partial [Acidobacteria bacterium]|nr:carboxypeptidase regulatory-like domain-containing protein [Acidobacteriota bacterium]